MIKGISSVAQPCPALCNTIDCSTPGFPVHHQFLDYTQTRDHRAGDAIQPSQPLINSRFSVEMKSSLGELPSENLQLGFPCGSAGKESTCNECLRPGFDPWVQKIP